MFYCSIKQQSLNIVVTIYFMMFIRSKKKGSKVYYWIVESKRIKDKVIQKPIKYIGSAKNLLKKLKLLEELTAKGS